MFYGHGISFFFLSLTRSERLVHRSINARNSFYFCQNIKLLSLQLGQVCLAFFKKKKARKLGDGEKEGTE